MPSTTNLGDTVNRDDGGDGGDGDGDAPDQGNGGSHVNDADGHEEASGIDPATAAGLLRTGERIGTRVYESIDFRTQAWVQSGTAVATLVYLGTFLALFGDEGTNTGFGGTNFTSIVLIPILALGQLSLGVRERLKATLPTHHSKLAATLGLLSLIPFICVAVGSMAGQHYPWWALLAVAIVPAIQPVTLAIFSVRGMRRSDIRPLAAAPVPLSDAGERVTAGLGLLFGLAAASGAFDWRQFAMLALMIVSLTMLALYRTRWGLVSVGGEWGSAQWSGFGASFALLMALTAILASVALSPTWLGVLGGLVVSLPLVIAAFRGSTIHERPEEFWDAPTPQS